MNIIAFSNYLFIFLTFFLASCSKDETENPVDYSNLEYKINEFRTKHKVASISLGLVSGDGLLWEYQTGFSNKEEKTLIQKESIYKLGSVSKPFTGLLLMKLVEQGKVDLDEDINKYLPFKVVNPHFPDEKITLRHIMTHTSGITDKVYNEKLLTDFVKIGEDHPMSLITFVRETLTPSGHYFTKETFADSKPGSAYSYSNVAVALAGCIIEEVSKQTFEDFSKQYITLPLEMSKTFWKISQVPPSLLAYPYGPEGENYGLYGMVDLPSGGLHGTMRDLARFMALLMNDGMSNGNRLFKSVSIEEVKRLHFPNASDPNMKNQALLLEHAQIGKYHLIGHNGKVPGSNTFMWMDTKEKRGVAIMVNSEFTSQKMMNDLMELLNIAFSSR